MAQASPPVPLDPESELKEFLEDAPPLKEYRLSDELEFDGRLRPFELLWPSITLYCGSQTCGGDRIFDTRDSEPTLGGVSEAITRFSYVHYYCRHCKGSRKTYALRVHKPKDAVKAYAMKYGENPPSIGPASRALKELLGTQWNMYLQGRRAELAGLGIGAFVYYRRAVEHVWQGVLARLIEVARIDGSQERLQVLIAAQGESKFTRSIDAAKGAVPATLYIDGHNPFQALYDACGDGVHEYTDDECVNRSRMIRLVLGRFADRASAVLSEDREFRQALGALASKTGEGAPPK